MTLTLSDGTMVSGTPEECASFLALKAKGVVSVPVGAPFSPFVAPWCDACRGGPWLGIYPPQHTCERVKTVTRTGTTTGDPP